MGYAVIDEPFSGDGKWFIFTPTRVSGTVRVSTRHGLNSQDTTPNGIE